MPAHRAADKPWTVEDSAAIYNLKGWGLRYFGINQAGNLTVHPGRDASRAIEISRIVGDIAGRGIKLPVLIRFQDILRHRVAQLNECFRKAIDEHKYKGRYTGVYPIKVNQLREVVEEILDAGEPYSFGLEAGSKGELIAVLAMNGPESLTVVNGYKDDSTLRLALIGITLGRKVVVVIEKPSELDRLIELSREAGVRPLVGMRARLQSPGRGQWRSSTGDAAKFGLTTPELLWAAGRLREADMADCARLLHFHVGSQVTDIQPIKEAVKEGARIYAKLRKMGLGLEYLDCGGGLGVDYVGTHTARDASTNYSLEEYVSDVVYSIQEVCAQEGVAEPNIVTESGRALVAHHAMLVVNVLGSIEAGASPIELPETPGEHDEVAEMRDILKAVSPRALAEAYHDALARREEAATMFKLGFLSLEDRAKIENLYWRVCSEIRRLAPEAKEVDEDVAEMFGTLRDQYLCNFSVFQSLPDSWAIGQVFPIMPIHRLNEEPSRRAVIGDITCDSDGKLTRFACHRKAAGLLPLHPLDGEPYYLGLFLMGAYQATMGDIHNLFGRVNEVHVFQDEEEPGGYYLEEVLHGQTIRDVLSSIQYSDFELSKMVKAAVEVRVKAGNLKPREGVDLLDAYEAVMEEYTYLHHEEHRPSAPPSQGQPASDSAQPQPAAAPAEPAAAASPGQPAPASPPPKAQAEPGQACAPTAPV